MSGIVPLYDWRTGWELYPTNLGLKRYQPRAGVIVLGFNRRSVLLELLKLGMLVGAARAEAIELSGRSSAAIPPLSSGKLPDKALGVGAQPVTLFSGGTRLRD